MQNRSTRQEYIENAIAGYLLFCRTPLLEIIKKYLKGEPVPENTLLMRLENLTEKEKQTLRKFVAEFINKIIGNEKLNNEQMLKKLIASNSRELVILGFAFKCGIGVGKNIEDATNLLLAAANNEPIANL